MLYKRVHDVYVQLDRNNSEVTFPLTSKMYTRNLSIADVKEKKKDNRNYTLQLKNT